MPHLFEISPQSKDISGCGRVTEIELVGRHADDFAIFVVKAAVGVVCAVLVHKPYLPKVGVPCGKRARETGEAFVALIQFHKKKCEKAGKAQPYDRRHGDADDYLWGVCESNGFENGVNLGRRGAGEAAKTWRVGRVFALVRRDGARDLGDQIRRGAAGKSFGCSILSIVLWRESPRQCMASATGAVVPA